MDGAEAIAKSPAGLPVGPFEVCGIRFEYGNQNATNESLTALKGLPGLREFGLGGADVGDTGLAHLAEVEGLVTRGINATKATGAVVDALTRLPSLEALTTHGSEPYFATWREGFRLSPVARPLLHLFSSGPGDMPR